MKRISAIILGAILLMQACSPLKQFQKGNNDQAIRLCVKKLRKKPNKQKLLVVLEQSYNNANRKDSDRITFLKKQGTPDIWDEIFQRLNNMKRRQDIVQSLSYVPPTIHFLNFDEEIINAKKKAAEYYYAHGKKLLERKNKEDARMAYAEFTKVKTYFSDFRDVDVQIRVAEKLGTTSVLFRIENLSGIILPKGFETDLLKISLSDLDSKWIRYYVNRIKDMQYDYTINLRLSQIIISPEQLQEKNHTEQKNIEDGWQYVFDSNGNVMKDSLGNDIKTPKIKTITCNVIETHQTKAAQLSGTLDYTNNQTGNLIKTDPITAETIFEHFSARAIGDMLALSPETKKKINGGPIPFPSNGDMIMQTGSKLKEMTKTILRNNLNILQ